MHLSATLVSSVGSQLVWRDGKGIRGCDLLCRTLKFWMYAYSVLTLNFTLDMGTSTLR